MLGFGACTLRSNLGLITTDPTGSCHGHLVLLFGGCSLEDTPECGNCLISGMGWSEIILHTKSRTEPGMFTCRYLYNPYELLRTYGTLSLSGSSSHGSYSLAELWLLIGSVILVL